MNNYTLVIISNRVPSENYFTYFQFYKSLEGEQILNLCDHYPNVYKNLSDRPRMLYKAFEDGLIKTEKILFCDSWDLVFVDKPDIIFEKWQDMKCDIAISAEKNCFPADYKEQFDKVAPTDTSYKYINCGTVLGYSDAFFEMLVSMDANYHPYDYYIPEQGMMHHFNEQLYYHQEFFKQPVNIKIDYYQNIAQCMQDVALDELSLFGGGSMEPGSQMITKIRNKETNSFPSIIHWNGSSKSAGTREPILKHLSL